MLKGRNDRLTARPEISAPTNPRHAWYEPHAVFRRLAFVCLPGPWVPQSHYTRLRESAAPVINSWLTHGRVKNPDPTLLRVGDDYFLSTSTFELFPGHPIYVSVFCH